MQILIELFKVLGTLYLCSELLCSMVGIGYLFNYMLSKLPLDNHSQQLRKSESDDFFDRVWEDSAKHGPVNLEDYDNH
jgi:hypothetical protein